LIIRGRSITSPAGETGAKRPLSAAVTDIGLHRSMKAPRDISLRPGGAELFAVKKVFGSAKSAIRGPLWILPGTYFQNY
jgi:hypothetical protein